MEVGMEMEDDVFFADLNRQISLLIMDDDEDTNAHCPSASLQVFSRAVQFPPTQATYSHNIQQNNCRRDQSKGTGVFIPQQSHPRRKNSRQGKLNNSKLQYRHSAENSYSRAAGLPTPASNNSFNPKKC
ncbi:uncharacterized protein LOC131321620 [Rhododendron vialii]|uniref:uncharacterized protein LOC131321620 n=1 Tax=Rhododendron vialii TaxID=182163 RepID=UPI00265DEC0F|nr:uncharacterized protein LOC131321620 [Rhododendron vialii]